MGKRLVVAAALLAASLLLGCNSSNQPGPLAAPSSDQPGYAARYPDALASTRGRFSEHEAKAREGMGKFGAYPDELQNPNWSDVIAVYDAADNAGKSSAYVERAKEMEHVAVFFNEEKGEINKKVGGAAQYAAKQKGCEADISGATAGALDKAVEKQMEKRLRERNEAHSIIDEREDSIGKPNREKLEKQADEISYTSYIVRVAIEENKREMEALIAEADAVKGTLDKSIEESKTRAADGKRSDNEKKKAQTRQENAEKAKARIDQEVAEAQKILEETENRMKAVRDEYDKAFGELKKKAEEKASAQPKAS